MKNKKRVLAAALLCAVALLSLSSCGGESSGAASAGNEAEAEVKAPGESAGIPVETQTVRLGSISSDNTVSGTVTADDESTVMVAVTAKVLDTFVESGDTVEEGQLLCRLELDSTLSNYRAARLSLSAAQQSYTDQSAVFDQQIAAINDQIALAEKQVPIAEQQIPLAEQQIPQLEQQVTALETQIAILEQQTALAEKQVNDLKALYAIGAASQAEIDSAELSLSQAKLQADQARIQVDQAKMQIDQANLTISQTALQPEQARLQVSQARLSLASAIAQRNSTLSQLQASIETARSSVQQLESALENIDGEGNVIAPSSGVLVSFNAVKDSYVGTTAPVAVINGTGKMDVTVSVSETLIPKLRIGDTADVTVAALGKRFTAVIRSVDQTASSMTRLYNVKLSVPEGFSSGLLSGMFADVTFHTDTIEEAVVIPSEAILNDGGTEYVYVVGAGGTARYTEVTTGMTGSGVTVITGGLNEGELLVTVGQSYLSDGDAVRIVGGD